MKIILILTSIFLFFLTSTCNNQKSKTDDKANTTSDLMEITGTIEPIGMTTWQYGTHTISNEEDFYALRSGKVDLQNYEGKKVTIKGEKVEGYPVENGPIFIEVTEIKE